MSSETPNLVSVERASHLILSDQVVALPTETVYGLAGSIASEKALRLIFSTKKRPFFDPLIVHVASIDQAKTLSTEWSPTHQLLAEEFWPGPLTLVLPKAKEVRDLITSGLSTVAIRWPRHELFCKVVLKSNSPLAAPSANHFGRTSPTSAAHVLSEFKNQIPVVDGGPCQVGIESTILRLAKNGEVTELQILRPGMIGPNELEAFGKKHHLNIKVSYMEKQSVPGEIEQHYQPKKPFALVIGGPEEPLDQCQKLLGLPRISKGELLSLSDSPEQAARELYAKLREADSKSVDFIYCFFKRPLGEEWKPILDRLKKASRAFSDQSKGI